MFILHPQTQRLEFSLQPLWIRYMDKPHDTTFGPVTHPFPLFWLILDGTRTIQVGDELHIISKGDLVSFPPGVPYMLHKSEPGNHVRYLALSCSVKLGPFIFHEWYPFPLITPVTDEGFFESFSNLWMESVQLFDRFVFLHERHDDHNDVQMSSNLDVSLALLRVQGTLQQWFAQLMTLLLPQISTQPLVIDPRIVQVCTYMQEHVHETLTLDKLAAHIYLSPSHFSYLFRSALGQPPAQYLRNYRIRLSKELLIQTSWSIREISQKVGYSDLSEFSRAFSKSAGQSPQAYRKEQRQLNMN
jgi:AraC-like DNA-binding protein